MIFSGNSLRSHPDLRNEENTGADRWSTFDAMAPTGHRCLSSLLWGSLHQNDTENFIDCPRNPV